MVTLWGFDSPSRHHITIQSSPKCSEVIHSCWGFLIRAPACSLDKSKGPTLRQGPDTTLDCNLRCVAASEEDLCPMPKQSGYRQTIGYLEVISQGGQAKAMQHAVLDF